MFSSLTEVAVILFYALLFLTPNTTTSSRLLPSLPAATLLVFKSSETVLCHFTVRQQSTNQSFVLHTSMVKMTWWW